MEWFLWGIQYFLLYYSALFTLRYAIGWSKRYLHVTSRNSNLLHMTLFNELIVPEWCHMTTNMCDWRHQAITWTKLESMISSKAFYGFVSQEVLMNLIVICWNITPLRLVHFPGQWKTLRFVRCPFIVPDIDTCSPARYCFKLTVFLIHWTTLHNTIFEHSD